MKKIFKQIDQFVSNTGGMFRSYWICLFRNFERPATFYGYTHWKLAKKYANKRFKKWPASYDQNGKQQSVFAIEDEKLLVCSKLELKWLKKRHKIEELKPRKAMKKQSFYKTKIS